MLSAPSVQRGGRFPKLYMRLLERSAGLISKSLHALTEKASAYAFAWDGFSARITGFMGSPHFRK